MVDGPTDSQQPASRLERKSGGIDFQEILKIIKIRRKYFYVLTALMLVGSLAKHIFYIPMYSASATISVMTPQRNPLLDAAAAPELTAEELIKKYARYLKSNGFYLSVAETLKFRQNYSEMNLTHPYEVSPTKAKFWRMFLSGSTQARDSAAELPNAPEPYLIPIEELGGMIQGLTKIETDETSTITITVTTLDPYTSMGLANAAADVFVKLTNDNDQQELTNVRIFLENQRKETTELLKRHERDLIAYKRKSNVLSIDKEHKGYAERLGRLDTDLETARLQKQQNLKLIEFYQSKLASNEAALLNKGPSGHSKSSAGKSGEIALIRRKIDSLQKQRELLLAQGRTERDWQVQKVNELINQTARSLQERLSLAGASTVDDETYEPADARQKIDELKKANAALTTQIETVQAARDKLLKGLVDLPQEEQTLLELTRKTELQFELYSNINKKLQEIEVQRLSSKSRIALDELSGIPTPIPRPSFVLRVVFALFAGLFLSGVLVAVLEILDNTVKHKADLEDIGLTLLGEVPQFEVAAATRLSLPNAYRPDLLVCRIRPESDEATAFKFMRTHLKHYPLPGGKQAKVFLVTSPSASEGKSVVAANLAVCNAQFNTGTRTVIVDCNLRNPGLPWIFGYQTDNGLTSLLSMQSLLEDIIIHDKIPRLDIIPAGRGHDNPTELIGDDKIALLLDYLRTEYDYVVLDAPPVLKVVDGAILARLSDIVIFVASYRKTKKYELMVAHQKILQVCNKRIHAVMNNIDTGAIEVGKIFSHPALKRIKPSQAALESELSALEALNEKQGKRKIG